MSAFPRVMIVSDACISSAHGTGTLVARHFSRYPAGRVCNGYLIRTGDPIFPDSLQFRARSSRTSGPGQFLDFGYRCYSVAVRRLGRPAWTVQPPQTFDSECPGRWIDAYRPDLLYSVVFTTTGLALVDHLLRATPHKLPLVQYFLDYQLTPGVATRRYLGRIIRRAEEVWALTDEIAAAINTYARPLGKDTEVVAGFHADLKATWKTEHRGLDEGRFLCVIVGNFWQSQMALTVQRVWRQVQQRCPSVGPILWLCHPDSVARTLSEIDRRADDLAPEILPGGFLEAGALAETLVAADMALIPFNTSRAPENDYSRYSLPSRLTEILSAGLPVFCIAGEKTPLARYVRDNGVGEACDAEDEERLACRIAEFIADPLLRAGIGNRGRRHADRQFTLQDFQLKLYRKLCSLTVSGTQANSR